LKSLHQNIPEEKNQVHKVLLIKKGSGSCNYKALKLIKKVTYTEVTTLEEGLNALKDKQNKFSTIILDLDLDDESIISFLKSLQRNLEWNYIPTIVMTQDYQDQRIAEHVDAGAFYYLNKASEANLLNAVLNKALKDYTSYIFYLKKAINQNIADLIKEGSFRFKTFKEAHEVADWLASICMGKARDDIVVGFIELLLNAIEHGNLGVSYDEKTELIKSGHYMETLVDRLNLPEYRDKEVEVVFNKSHDELKVTIKDMGEGFDFEKFLVVDKQRLFHSHGKGILMAKNLYFNELIYQAPGNIVNIKVLLNKT